MSDTPIYDAMKREEIDRFLEEFSRLPGEAVLKVTWWNEGWDGVVDASCVRCGADDWHFDRTICACGVMHDYCGECGFPSECPLDEQEF